MFYTLKVPRPSCKGVPKICFPRHLDIAPWWVQNYPCPKTFTPCCLKAFILLHLCCVQVDMYNQTKPSTTWWNFYCFFFPLSFCKATLARSFSFNITWNTTWWTINKFFVPQFCEVIVNNFLDHQRFCNTTIARLFVCSFVC